MKFFGYSQHRALAACLTATGALALWSSDAVAQEETGGAAYLESLKTCQSVTDDAERLACYDTAVGRVVAATDEGDVRIVNTDDIRKTRRGLFGFSLPKVNLFGSEQGEDDLLQSVVTDVRIAGRNTVFLTIEEGGAVWRIPSADSRVMRTRPGDSVEFKRAALGSYFIRINGRNGVKGRRVE